MKDQPVYVKRAFASGVNAMVMALALVGIASVLYTIVDRFHLRWDVTANKRFSLSDQTIGILSAMKKEVQVHVFSKEGSPQKQMIEDLLKQYGKRSANLKVVYVDPDKAPTSARRYEVRSYDTVVFESGKMRKDVTPSEIFILKGNPMMGGPQEPPEFNGEQVFTSALLNVTEPEKPRLCFTEGHGEKNIESSAEQGYSEIKKLLENENYLVDKVNLVTEHKIPSNCRTLLVAGPKVAFFPEEINLLKTFVKNGGSVLFALDAMNAPGMEDVLKTWGMKPDKDIVVDLKSSNFFDPLSPIPQYRSHEITEKLMEQRLPIILPETRSIREETKKPDGVTVQVLLETSPAPDGFGETDLTTQKVQYDEGKDIPGPLSVALAATVKTRTKEGKKEKEAEGRVMAVGDSDFVLNGNTRHHPNVDFFVNAVNWLSREEKKIGIRAKSPEMRMVEVTPDQAKWILRTTVFLSPGFVVFLGGWIWYRRRSL